MHRLVGGTTGTYEQCGTTFVPDCQHHRSSASALQNLPILLKKIVAF